MIVIADGRPTTGDTAAGATGHANFGFVSKYEEGAGAVNGGAGYAFMPSAAAGVPDAFRMRVWKTADDTPVHDDQIGWAPDADPTTALAGGSIVIHGG
ncbi:hypothetical protein [Streptomyces litmocidini]|uniref:hypothetical protein n=1 Tax=Streptomyces litmocidini TaxID=67318 RepID=UPI0036F8312E